MDDADLRLDGNAAAGVLREVFLYDLSGATGQCASCGAIGEVGGQHLYMQPLSPGAVLRCRSCESVLVVFVHNRGRYRLGLQGLKWFEIQEMAEAGAGSV